METVLSSELKITGVDEVPTAAAAAQTVLSSEMKITGVRQEEIAVIGCITADFRDEGLIFQCLSRSISISLRYSSSEIT